MVKCGKNDEFMTMVGLSFQTCNYKIDILVHFAYALYLQYDFETPMFICSLVSLNSLNVCEIMGVIAAQPSEYEIDIELDAPLNLHSTSLDSAPDSSDIA